MPERDWKIETRGLEVGWKSEEIKKQLDIRLKNSNTFMKPSMLKDKIG